MFDPLSAFHAALLTAGTSPVDIICIGDSITEGMVAPHREDAWPQRLRDLVRAHCFSGSVKGGIGYCPSYSVSASVGDFWSKSAGVVVSVLWTGLGCRALKVPNGEQVSLEFTGTGVDVLTTTGANSALTYQVDSNAPVTVDQRQSGDVQSGVVIPIRGLCDGSHSIIVSGCSLGNAYVEGAAVYRGDETSGVRVWESGHSGWMCDDYNATDRWHGSFQAVPNPKLVIVSLLTNEYQNGLTSAQYGRGLDALLTTVTNLLAGRDCNVLMMTAHARLPLPDRAAWSVYEAMALSMAADHGAAYLAMSPVIGDAQTAIDAGLLQSGAGVHPTTAGHAKYAHALAGYLLP